MEAAKKKPHLRNWRSFEEARTFVHRLDLHGQSEWKKWIKSKARPNDIPVSPDKTYKDKGWIGWGDWFGTSYIANQNRAYQLFGEARKFVQALGLRNQDAWKMWAKSDERPSDIPAWPDGVYKNKGWVNWADWLGTK
jgi:hypothetical protein